MGKKATKFYCGDCYIVFEILSDFDGRELKYKNCPGCADHAAVKVYHEPGETEQKYWSAEELDLLDKFIAKEIHIYQLKIMTGRNENSIYMKMHRRTKEKGLPKKRKPIPWTKEHLELLDEVIHGKLTMDRMIEITGRRYRSIENRKYSRIRELGLTQVGRRYNAWTEKELELADKCIAGEISCLELAEKVNRKLKTVRNFIGVRKQKQGVKAND